MYGKRAGWLFGRLRASLLLSQLRRMRERDGEWEDGGETAVG